MREQLARDAAAAAQAADKLAARSTPGVRTRALTLGDHDDVLYTINCGPFAAITAPSGVLANASRLAAAGFDGRGSRDPRFRTLEGLYEVINSACRHAEKAPFTDARSALRAEVLRCRDTTASAAQNRTAQRSPRRNLLKQSAEAASSATWELANALTSHLKHMGVGGLDGIQLPRNASTILADLNAVLEPVMTVLTHLETVAGYEALMIDAAFRDAGIERRAGAVSEPLIHVGRALAKARLTLSVAHVTVRDAPDEYEG